ncbi:unnamed protein product, partial [marine sediment metagenome]
MENEHEAFDKSVEGVSVYRGCIGVSVDSSIRKGVLMDHHTAYPVGYDRPPLIQTKGVVDMAAKRLVKGWHGVDEFIGAGDLTLLSSDGETVLFV